MSTQTKALERGPGGGEAVWGGTVAHLAQEGLRLA